MNKIFRDMLYSCVVVYLDDILVFSQDLQSRHHQDVTNVLQCLRDNQLYAKLEKCSFDEESLPFLGYVVSSQGSEMDPQKTMSIHDWPQPTCLKALRRFLGFTNYYRLFIQHYSMLTAQLTAMPHKGANPSQWSPKAMTAFQELKKAFLQEPCLRQPDPRQPFVVEDTFDV
ncbi:uncharacterized protein LOC115094730 [Rhinatrema bivittatum]|uniref:uncharacterized protein LOC115094730 n=1 Tax=Rhinatrema bivittatum TaxID=194408 RepID=UPI00112823BB|nr:uncharacterized protein LOC115094730 [Rhinatrema bivittatum]